MRRSILMFRLLVGLLLAAAVVQVATVVPRVWALASDLPVVAGWIIGAYAVSAATALLAIVLGLFLLWRGAEHRAARALTLFLALLSVFWGSLFRFMEVGSEADTVSVGFSFGSGWDSQSALAAILLAVAAFVRFTALFPRPLTPDRLGPARILWLRRIREATLRPVPVWGTAVALFLLIRAIPTVVGWLLGEPPFTQARIGVLITANIAVALLGLVVVPALAVAVGALNLRKSYRLADPDERRRMMWVQAGFTSAIWLVVAAVGVAIVVGAFDLPERIAIAVPALFVLAPLLVVSGCVAGVFHSGAIDPALALERSTVYGFLAASAVVAFAAFENGLSALIEERLGLPGFSGSMVAGALVAVLLIPIRRPIKRIVSERLSHTAPPAPTDSPHIPER